MIKMLFWLEGDICEKLKAGLASLVTKLLLILDI